MLRSVPFDTFLVILLLGLLGLRLPQPVYTVAGMFGQANAFLAMLMIGLLLEPRIDVYKRQPIIWWRGAAPWRRPSSSTTWRKFARGCIC